LSLGSFANILDPTTTSHGEKTSPPFPAITATNLKERAVRQPEFQHHLHVILSKGTLPQRLPSKGLFGSLAN
jgi:hypothetical protein